VGPLSGTSWMTSNLERAEERGSGSLTLLIGYALDQSVYHVTYTHTHTAHASSHGIGDGHRTMASLIVSCASTRINVLGGQYSPSIT
jgi:hypothetical protein